MRRSSKFESINVVPFIDIMLVLFVIVLTTASFIQTGVIKVDLPSGSSEVKQKPKKELAISIKNNGDVFFGKEKISHAKVEEELLKHNKKTPIQLYSDKDAKFESFVFILDLLKKHQYEDLGIVTKK